MAIINVYGYMTISIHIFEQNMHSMATIADLRVMSIRFGVVQV
jgi:hypothetical protein